MACYPLFYFGQVPSKPNRTSLKPLKIVKKLNVC